MAAGVFLGYGLAIFGFGEQIVDMAWRIDQNVKHAEFDFRVAGKVLGRIWLEGLPAPVRLQLDGSPEADLRGQVLIINNPKVAHAVEGGFSLLQEGKTGDMTASRKVKVPELPIDEVSAMAKKGEAYPWHWGNSLYLEWYSRANGRVVLESVDLELRINDAGAVIAVDDAQEEEDEDAPRSRREAEAEVYAEYMNLLVDRVALRLEDEGNEQDYDAIFTEEREKLRSQYGLDDGEMEDGVMFHDDENAEDPENEAWVNGVLEQYKEAEEDDEAGEEEEEQWEDGEEELDEIDWRDDVEQGSEDSHPLVNACLHRSEMIHRDMQQNRWLPESCQEDHPLEMMHQSVMFAGVKLSGALMDALEEWPPEACVTGHILVGLKAARRKFRDALLALECCKTEGLAEATWLGEIETDVRRMLAQVTELIEEARAVLDAGEQSDTWGNT